MFLFVFYIAQKLPHQESYGVIKKNFHHHQFRMIY